MSVSKSGSKHNNPFANIRLKKLAEVEQNCPPVQLSYEQENKGVGL